MSTWMTLILGVLCVVLPVALMVLARLRAPTSMASAGLDFTGNRRRAPQLHRARPGSELPFEAERRHPRCPR